jgi:hypothetical protein
MLIPYLRAYRVLIWLDNTRLITNRQDEGIEISNCPEHLALSHPTNGPHPEPPKQLFSEAWETNNDFLEAGWPVVTRWTNALESGPTLGWFAFHQSSPGHLSISYFSGLTYQLVGDRSIDSIERNHHHRWEIPTQLAHWWDRNPDFPGKLLIVRVNHSKYNNLLTIWSFFFGSGLT